MRLLIFIKQALREAFDGQLEVYLYAYRLDAAENGKWLFFDTLKLDFFSKKNKTLRRPYTLGL